MKTIKLSQKIIRLGTGWVLGAGLLAAALGVSASPAMAASLPPSTCNLSGSTRTCDLYAETGVMPASALPGAPAAGIPVWGYNTSAAAVTAPGGPTLIANQGETLVINLHNDTLPDATSLMVAGQPVIPDVTGVAPGSSKTYTLPTLNPGTYIYEAGLTSDGPRQVAMGLFGALIVRPAGAPLQAYASASTAFTDEAVLVLSEIDPAFNAAPLTYDIDYLSPKYWLINGQVFQPGQSPISTAAGDTVLLRYVNAGLQHHSMALLGLHQTIVATDGSPETNPLTLVAQTVPTGGTLDTLVSIPAAAPAGTEYAVFDAAMHADNAGISSAGVITFGGMVTFLQVGGTSTANGGPVTSSVTIAPTPTNGSAAVTLNATFTSAASTVTAGEYFVDALGASGSGTPVSGTYGTAVVNGQVVLPPAALALLASGNHTFYVHAQDATGAWGAVASTVLNLDQTGPVISGMSLTPNQDNGTLDVQLQATASDVATGNQNVVAAEYFIDPSGTPAPGTGAALTIATPTTIVSLSATLPAATIAGLTSGTHNVSVRAQDALGNWGAFGSISIRVDVSGPAISAVTVQPSPNNGTLGVQVSSGGAFYVRIDASVSDVASGNSNVAAAEYFFDTIGANGAGGVMFPTDGGFNSPTEATYAAVDLMNIAALPQGNHTIYVHGKDASGNWGGFSTTTLVVDKTAPIVSSLNLAPAATNTTPVVVSATANDTTTGNSNIAGGEYYIDVLGAAGGGAAMTPAAASPSTTLSATLPAASLSALTVGTHTLYVRAQDKAGNWSTPISALLLIDRTAPTFTSITLAPTSIIAGTASVNLTVNGASDGAGGSGVTGGEYWFGAAAPAPGSGTAFTGLTSVPVSTAALSAGSYTLSVRIRDAAGNWSTIHTAALTVTAPVIDAIFSNDFEASSGSVRPWGWSSASTTSTTRLNVTAAAKDNGSLGLRVQGSNTNYVQYNFTPAASTYDAHFYFNPNGNASTGQTIFAGATSTGFGTQLFSVRYRLNGAQAQVQIQVGATANPNWVNITNAYHGIEVVYQAVGSTGPNPGTLTLYVDSAVASQTLTATSTGSVAAVRLGSVTSGGSATLEYFDTFSSKRSVTPLLGP